MSEAIAILGCGRIGSVHARTITEHIPSVDLVLSDANTALAENLAGSIDAEVTPVDRVFDDPRVRAVAICTSTDSHLEYIQRAAAAGLAVFCEKPISLDLDEVDQAEQAVLSSGVPFMVGFHKRFDPTHRATKQAILDGRVGEVQLVRITTRDPQPPPREYLAVSGGIFLDMTIHDFDMARFMVDSPVEEIFARGAVLVDPVFEEVGDFDTAVVWMRHENGAMTVIDNSRRATYGHDQRVEVFGSLGMASSLNGRVDATQIMDGAGKHEALVPYHFLERYSQAYVEEWLAFWSYVTEGGPSPVSIDDGRIPVELGVKAWESARTGLPITI